LLIFGEESKRHTKLLIRQCGGSGRTICTLAPRVEIVWRQLEAAVVRADRFGMPARPGEHVGAQPQRLPRFRIPDQRRIRGREGIVPALACGKHARARDLTSGARRGLAIPAAGQLNITRIG
jgi:hypothetical protein